ncbi:glycosyltransferase [Superficieibacter sp. 1612_C1]|uniref:glycosyltransferase n=1 Tax=Superficieibacter sp. 1612_C1 TaxID=2780382 RepID=UPI0018831633|nr:glycosyltransferase [Superficieibacter sp. 1612_C1]
MIKKNIVFVIGQLDIGGIESWLYDFVKRTNNKYNFSFIVDKKHVGFYEPEIVSMGCEVIHISSSKNKLAYLYDLYKAFNNHEYDICHTHVSFTNGLVVLIAKLCKIPKTISHSHSDRSEEVKGKSYFKRLFINFQITAVNLFSNHRIAVSTKSAECHYHKTENIEIIPCGKDFSSLSDFEKIYTPGEFGFNKEDVILGSVGRLELVKNHKFLLEIIRRLNEPHIKLLIIGSGSQYNELIKTIDNYKIQDRVKIVQGSTDVLRIMRDIVHIFLFPSLHEGLGLAAIEAQAAGLPVIASTNVPNVVDLTDNICHLNTDDINLWVSQLKKFGLNNQKKHVFCASEEVFNSAFSIENNISKVLRIYNEK